MMDLQQLYQELILDHGTKPRNFGCLEPHTHHQSGYNPLCGDSIEIYIKVVDDIIVDIKFDGKGCAISMASSSLLSEQIKGKTVAEFMAMFDEFHQVMTEDAVGTNLGKLEVLRGVKEFPMRIKCATLAWHALKGALEGKEKEVSTES